MEASKTTRIKPFWSAPELAQAGYPVFPINNKAPSVDGGFYAATTDNSKIAQWLEEGRAHHDVAFATGLPSLVVVIDTDTPQTYDKMRSKHGEPDVKAERGGHWYFGHPQDGRVSSTTIEPGLDRKADGGYALIPPSRVYTSGGGRIRTSAGVSPSPDWAASANYESSFLKPPQPQHCVAPCVLAPAPPVIYPYRTGGEQQNRPERIEDTPPPQAEPEGRSLNPYGSWPRRLCIIAILPDRCIATKGPARMWCRGVT